MLMLTLEIHAASAATSGNVSSTSEMDWTPVMDAIIQVESKGDPKAKSGNSRKSSGATLFPAPSHGLFHSPSA